MRTVPRNKTPQIEFYSVHVPKWAEEAEALALDPEQVALLQAKVDAARAAFQAQQIAQAKARTKTQALRFALKAMNTEGASILKQIRARSAALGSQAYILGLIAAPEKPSPIGPPGTPSRFTAELTQLGTVILRWKCRNPHGARGTTYHVSRALQCGEGGDGGGKFEFLGIAGRKRFEDATLPPGARGALYRIQALRSTSAGPVATHIVRFGFSSHGLPVPGKMQLAA